MTQEIKLRKQSLAVLVFSLIALIGGGLIALTVFTEPCLELTCLVQFIAPVLGIFAAGTLFAIQLFAWRYAENRKAPMILAVFLAIILSSIVSISIQPSADAIVIFTFFFLSYILNYWWALLLIFVLPVLLMRYVKLKGFWKRFIAFLFILIVVPGVINGVVHTLAAPVLAEERSFKMSTSGLSPEEIAQRELERQAIQQNNPEMCEDIADLTIKGGCISKFAKQRNDITLCEKLSISAQADLCYVNIAEQLQDATLCDKVQDSWKKNDCLRRVAISANKPELCKNITDQSNCFFETAVTHMNTPLCDLLEEQKRKKDCYMRASKTVEECIARLPDETKDCTFWVAITTRNTGLCKTLQKESAKTCLGVIEAMLYRETEQ